MVLAVVSALCSAQALAAQLQVEVRVNVMRGCQLVGLTRDAGIDQLGVLDFGNTARLNDPAGPLSAALTSTRLPRLECNPDTPYQVRIDGGLHGGIGEVRYLEGDARSSPIPYRLYRDAARRIALPVNEPVSGTVPDSGSVELPLYARIEPLARIPRVSRYTDVVKVTVTW
ncbi:Csu type fimbrial protein [Pseudomonas gingeri]|uniref:Csu type fimbrial protein n=1 Tax=Pseudomonas gingeri TaxID=117681 RepID=UPI0015A45213|nr:spore coat U domain-containing protein [Pseudomonas gingeri]NWA03681.1 spore coat protein U domain-containing protein [Pseudomonas gingeri]NWA14540.1 spore coat protein U domain-containing protein [Pseudomonas gingeri]NWA54842.1 spore coat protein U domain-containing protein [Pseudomonas gingeri]NWA94566.1 spore coat protein U domain-containing protein [Pseudomonas gingeri]NWB01222.1 spore coat protein U domain-containing protein [Pseudomonas gingeri]